ncbi:VPLPA-CTERM protein sorting domain protein [Jannaschia seosinensis]|uniref:VPLPA-CTERM protein sorting domain protein n=1 Tax=Jannaschia seosinensis TaxID=313367 RepID=A0A0M7B906_9RHOB|nr:VPLPA-CTERM sorting domain-containing protein [Jannaschia seosinensis]CUH20474.1 VPLPA-CTERM protein sorting domain protein [Jannaschia seosinensis]
MKLVHTFAAALLAVTASVGAASAGTFAATSIYDVVPGDRGEADANRDTESAALGFADGEFYSLGLGGAATFGFGRTFPLANAVNLFEITFGSTDNIDSYLERVEVFALLGGTETSIGTLTNLQAQGGASLSYGGAFDALRLVDTTPLSSPSFDGFDVDAVTVVSPVPLPAAGMMLLAGLGGFGAMRRRKKTA